MKKLITIAAFLAATFVLNAQEIKITGNTETFKTTIAPGEKVSMPTNYVRFDTELEATVNSKKFQPFTFGRGNEKLYRGMWVEITETEAIVWDVVLVNKDLEEDAGGYTVKKTARVREPKEVARFDHNLPLKKAKIVSARISCIKEEATLYITAGKNSFETPLKGWFGGGEPFIRNNGKTDFDAELSFTRCNAGEPVWFVGASYFNSASSARWPYYMRKEGYDHWMGDHLPGGNSSALLKVFKDDLKFGTPKYLVWDGSGNDSGDTDVPNPNWLRDINELMDICKEKNIELIFTIHPFVKKDLSPRINYQRSTGYRIFDMMTPINNPDGSWKNPSWLGKDGVHPTKEGAKVMWEAFKEQLPDLLIK